MFLDYCVLIICNYSICKIRKIFIGLENKSIKLFILILLTSIGLSQEEQYSIELKNGNTMTGELLSKDESSVTLKTEFGELVIPKENIQSIVNLDADNNEYSLAKTEQEKQPVQAQELNQEARWRSIYAAMSVGNTLYGVGIPYLLDWGSKDADQLIGFRLLVFGATYSISSSYTKNMDLPLGRSYLQFAGANLGFYSIVPIVSLIGLDNWNNFDPKGKVALTYSMFSVPYGVITADRLYNKWKLSNGQSYLISLGINLGALNTIGLIQQTEWVEWADRNPENFARWVTSLTYGGAIAGAYLAKNVALNSSSITEGDVGFLNLSLSIGYMNSLLLGYLVNIDNYKSQTLLTMAGVNGFLYLGNKLNKNYGSLTQGQEKIVALGVGASYLTWIGCALITGVDYTSRSSRIYDIASITAGWYFSRKAISNQGSEVGHSSTLDRYSFSIRPTVVNQNNSLSPGVNINLRF